MAAQKQDFDTEAQFENANDDPAPRSKAQPQQISPTETALWHILHGPKLAHLIFIRNVVVSGYTIDYYCAEKNLGLQIVGPWHSYRAQYDRERKRSLAATGVTLLQIASDHLFTQPLTVHDAIVEATNAK